MEKRKEEWREKRKEEWKEEWKEECDHQPEDTRKRKRNTYIHIHADTYIAYIYTYIHTYIINQTYLDKQIRSTYKKEERRNDVTCFITQRKLKK